MRTKSRGRQPPQFDQEPGPAADRVDEDQEPGAGRRSWIEDLSRQRRPD